MRAVCHYVLTPSRLWQWYVEGDVTTDVGGVGYDGLVVWGMVVVGRVMVMRGGLWW